MSQKFEYQHLSKYLTGTPVIFLQQWHWASTPLAEGKGGDAAEAPATS